MKDLNSRAEAFLESKGITSVTEYRYEGQGVSYAGVDLLADFAKEEVEKATKRIEEDNEILRNDLKRIRDQYFKTNPLGSPKTEKQ